METRSSSRQMTAAPIVETAKRHAVKAVGGISLAGIMAWAYATFVTLADHRATKADVQELREKVAVLEWAAEHPERHADTPVWENAQK